MTLGPGPSQARDCAGEVYAMAADAAAATATATATGWPLRSPASPSQLARDSLYRRDDPEFRGRPLIVGGSSLRAIHPIVDECLSRAEGEPYVGANLDASK